MKYAPNDKLLQGAFIIKNQAAILRNFTLRMWIMNNVYQL